MGRLFTNAIVKKPAVSITRGLTTANLGLPDIEKAMLQHNLYVDSLKKCGLNTIILDADVNYPDSTFIEDTALLIPQCAIITNPGALSRKGEIISIKEVLRKYYSTIEEILSPGTVEAGDILMVGTHFYIGISERTNLCGAKQVKNILHSYGMSTTLIKLKKMLHLKTGLAYLENNNLVASGEFLTRKEFQSFNIIEIPETESYAANCLWINGKVLIAEGYPIAKQRIKTAGYEIIEVDVSEFQKLDGGLSCLSLRF